MVHDVDETVGVHRIPHSWSEFSATLRSSRLRQVDDWKIGPFDYEGKLS